MNFEEDVLLIAGPTASGKTSLSIEAAKAENALIINTDSMQVYDNLHTITARPSYKEETLAQHLLFGYVNPAIAHSVAQWLDDVSVVLADNPDRKLIFVGGTGLYFNALTQGLSPVPPIDPQTREKWRLLAKEQERDLHAELQKLDPVIAHQINTTDTQRIVRALEVIDSTGRSLLEWQQQRGMPLLGKDLSVRKFLIMPDRGVLHDRINRRFDSMIKEGALDEVEAFLALDLDPDLPAMKAIGVPHLGRYLTGHVSLEEAVEQAKAATRQYAKRQSTWFRNSFDDDWLLHQ